MNSEGQQDECAIKLLPREMSQDSEHLKYLQREVNRCHQIVHPNIVRIGYFWHESGEPAFITLEYVDGLNLDALKKQSAQGLLRWSEVQHYMIQLCDALEHAHSKNIAHRDIKPSNFLIDQRGNLKLADFGIAASLAGSTVSFTSSPEVM